MNIYMGLIDKYTMKVVFRNSPTGHITHSDESFGTKACYAKSRVY